MALNGSLRLCRRFLMIYDIRMLRTITPMRCTVEPYFLKFVPSYTNRVFIVSHVSVLLLHQQGLHFVSCKSLTPTTHRRLRWSPLALNGNLRTSIVATRIIYYISYCISFASVGNICCRTNMNAYIASNIIYNPDCFFYLECISYRL